jgi:hypothetical protein
MSAETDKRECPSCHGTSLMEGRTGVYKHTFIPEGQWVWLGYTARAFVCLDCGFLGHFLTEEDVRDLRSRKA